MRTVEETPETSEVLASDQPRSRAAKYQKERVSCWAAVYFCSMISMKALGAMEMEPLFSRAATGMMLAGVDGVVMV